MTQPAQARVALLFVHETEWRIYVPADFATLADPTLARRPGTANNA